MTDLSKVVQGLSYSVAGALDGLENVATLYETTGWKSALDNSSDPIVVQIKLDNVRSFNRLSLEMLEVPQKFAIYYMDSKRNKFVRIQGFDGYLTGEVNGSKAGIETQESWQSFRFAFPFVKTDLIEIRITRSTDKLLSFNLPKTTRYSVGLKNVQIRFHRSGPDASGINEDAEYNVEYFAPNSVLDNSSAYWKSPPLGPNSLYPFYVDLRASDGNAQAVEFMKLIPLFSDSHVNLYTSNDEGFGLFSVSTNTKSFTLKQKANSPSTVSTSLSDNWLENQGILVQSYNYWELFNQDIRANLNTSFTIGFTYNPKNFTNNADHYFWNFASDTNSLICYLDPSNTTSTKITGTLYVKYDGTEQVSISNVELEKETEYGIVCSYDSKTFEWHLAICPIGTSSVTREVNVKQFIGFYPSIFRFGYDAGASNATKTTEAGYAQNLWVRQDAYQVNYVNTFFGNTETFINGWGNKKSRSNGFYNAVLVAKLSDGIVAKVGPNASYYENKVWVPANKNFVLNSSTYYLGRINTKFLKLEFAKPTAQYYNPATSEAVYLPIIDFPQWVKTWYENHRFDSTLDARIPNNLFEGKRQLRNTSSSYGVNNFKTAFESSPNSLIFNEDKIGTDYLLAPVRDEEVLRNQISRNALTPQFPTISRHNYKIFDYLMSSKRAFFYGIVELSFFNLDQSVAKDNKVYYGDFLDANIDDVAWIESNDGFFITEDHVAMSSAPGDVIESKTLKSFSNFNSVQVGLLESSLKDLFTQNKINFVDTSHLSRTDDGVVQVIENMIGSTDGQTVILQRLQDGYYGIETTSTTLSSDGGGVKLVAGCRVRSSARKPTSHYELQLLMIDGSSETIVARKPLDLADDYNWQEIDLVYYTNVGEDTFKLKIMDLESFSDETLYIDMLGLWGARNKWELSNDDGTTWVPLINNINNASGLVAFDGPGTELKLKITSLEASSWVSEWIILPVYDFAPVGMGAPRLFDATDAENPDFKEVINQKFFSKYSTSIPRNYSIITDVVGSKNKIE